MIMFVKCNVRSGICQNLESLSTAEVLRHRQREDFPQWVLSGKSEILKVEADRYKLLFSVTFHAIHAHILRMDKRQ